MGNNILVDTKACLPLVKGGRGMFHRPCDAMRTEHPPSPLRKGEEVYHPLHLSVYISRCNQILRVAQDDTGGMTMSDCTSHINTNTLEYKLFLLIYPESQWFIEHPAL